MGHMWKTGAAVAVLMFAAEGLAAESAGITFGDVRPILARRCGGCHSRGEIGPMPLTTYAEVRPWAKAVREAVATRQMPPWHAAPGTPHAFLNDRSMPKGEVDAVVRWVDAGSPDSTEPIPRSHAVVEPGGWKLGEPDLVLRVPGVKVPRDGVMQYTFVIFPLHIEKDTWIRAAEWHIDRRGQVHHMNAFVREPGSSYLAGFPANEIFVPTVAERGKKRADEPVFARRQLLLGYEPGYAPMPWLEGGAKLIRAGSDIVFEMHYNPNGLEVVDHTELGLYFSAAAPGQRVIAVDTLRDLDLAIPPGAAAYKSEAAMKLGAAAKLLSIQPHMHVRGQSMVVRAVYPDGRKETLLDVPKYDFNWQTTYVLKEPLVLPAGTVLESVAHFDNSPNNKYNPDPKATVGWGDQTTSEMHIAFLELAVDAKANVEQLLTTQPKMIGEKQAGR